MSYITPAKAIENLRTLYALMAGVPDHRVILSTWRSNANELDDEQLIQGCRTSACAVGWACAYPEFQKQGLRYSKFHEEPKLTTSAGNFFAFNAVEEFFDVDSETAHALFGTGRGDFDAYKRDGVRWAEMDIQEDRKVVMRRIRRLLLKNGHITPERNRELAREEGVRA